MTAVSANMFWMFTEAGDSIADRIRAAHAAGIEYVEMWGWRSHDIDAIEAALHETGVTLLSLIVEPQLSITDPAVHEEYLTAVRESLAVAERLGAVNLVAVAGQELDAVPRSEQHATVVTALREAAALLDGTAVTLLLENLNSRLVHIGTYLYSVREGLDIVREVDSPHVRLLLDAYHALVMDEDIVQEIGGDIALVGHVQVADLPGRQEPGTGAVDWAAELGALRELGYRGVFGMEYKPSQETVASLREVVRIVDELDATSE